MPDADPADIAALVGATGDLLREMEQAAVKLRAAGSPIAQRRALVAALQSITVFLRKGNGAVRPLLVLIDALLRLEMGDIAPVLGKVGKSGRSMNGLLRGSMEGHALGVVNALTDCGVTPLEARCLVAAKLTIAGVLAARGKSRITEKTIRTWQSRASADPKSPAAIYFRAFDCGRLDERTKKSELLRSVSVIARRFSAKAT